MSGGTNQFSKQTGGSQANNLVMVTINRDLALALRAHRVSQTGDAEQLRR